MEIAGNSNAETSTAFLQQLRENHPGPLVVIWDNGPAHRGEAIRSYLATPDLHLRLVALPAYSPDFNADEAVWDWAREEVTANECLGTKAQVQEKMNAFFDGLTHRKDEVRHRCRTLLQARADALMFTPAVPLPSLQNVVPPWLWFRHHHNVHRCRLIARDDHPRRTSTNRTRPKRTRRYPNGLRHSSSVHSFSNRSVLLARGQDMANLRRKAKSPKPPLTRYQGTVLRIPATPGAAHSRAGARPPNL